MGATTAGGHGATPEDASGLSSIDGRIVTVRVEHSLSLVDLAEVLCCWAAGVSLSDADPPTSQAEALAIVRDTLAFDGEQWDRWRDAAAGQDTDEIIRASYGWAARCFGPLFAAPERERLATLLAQEVPGATL